MGNETKSIQPGPSPRGPVMPNKVLQHGEEYYVSHPNPNQPSDQVQVVTVELCWGQCLKIVPVDFSGESRSSPSPSPKP